MYFVYLLINESGGRYIGFTDNLERRLGEHNKGLNKSTRGHVWKVAYYEAYTASKDARRRERNLKKSGQARRWLYERASESLCI